MRPATLPANSANAIAPFPSQDIQPARQRHVSDTVDHLPGNLRGEELASYMEWRLPQSNELYLAARTLTTDALQTDLLMHSRKLRGYIGISNRLRNQLLPASSTIPSRFAFEALAWAAPRLSSPYQERAISQIDTALHAAATPIQRNALLTELGKHFDKFEPASRQRIASQLLTESRIRAMPDDVLDPFRLCLAEARCIAREQLPGLASPSNRQQHQVNRPT